MVSRVWCILLGILLAAVPIVSAQTAGAIEGTVRDAQGLVMPGVAVTLTGEAVLGEQVATTVETGPIDFEPSVLERTASSSSSRDSRPSGARASSWGAAGPSL